MKLGIHAYAWCSQWSNGTLDLIDRVKRLELDFIEIPLMTLDTFDAVAVKKRLEDAGLDAVTSTVLLRGTDIASPDPAIRAKGIEYLKDCARATAAIGKTNLSGVVYSEHVKNAKARPTEQEWDWAAEGLREAAVYARELGVQIGLEPVNRYESNLINTCEQALKLKNLVGEPNIKIHLDTYHMNIEEKSFYEATKAAGSDLIHYHICENDRGIPGTGLVDWDSIFRALSELNYTGYAALESFVDVTDNMNTWVWRQLAPSGDVLVAEGVRFIRGKMAEYGLA
ncbi:sugar phosphate isomerase/epimerase family protein [Cohnella thailandensis]|uniref:Sugar phosphate isomerase/epimerase n=1 Tax=Cohnella thailandensis TaxID=557557 RepID=A0A841SZ40_9BACL|nr:sugar phosphate isomerase/epimerase family protein [Cohnella thailandensis]MBB6635896.1 sugar phosphate isomerase/epimerase [Cohnella thailandensis]MBP1976274.1 D-psicose/D-tagatose/L-ribulose 3-epimerase [Cohnella thailandensis]